MAPAPAATASAPTTADLPQRQDRVVVTDAAEADIATVVALDERITGVSRRDFWNHIDTQRRASGNTLCVLVAKRTDASGDERIIGYAMGEVRAWPVRAQACGWIYAIGVEQGHRLQRAASALMSALIARFKAQGCSAVRTMIDVDDHLLMSFLRSQGMTAGPFVELEMAIEPAAPKAMP
jgi:GNAT superfamily N-acetyltransferase